LTVISNEALQRLKKFMEVERMKQFYLRNKGNKCPYCRGDQLDTPSCIETFDDSSAIQNVKCTKCGKTWRDRYILNDVDFVEE